MTTTQSARKPHPVTSLSQGTILIFKKACMYRKRLNNPAQKIPIIVNSKINGFISRTV
uniref:Uncharacterized protein n=1 Tax=Anguilla anguilla TaxID=7936 RepID=A0A0E9QX82_ANGAN